LKTILIDYSLRTFLFVCSRYRFCLSLRFFCWVLDPRVWYILFFILFGIINKNADTSIIAIIDQDCFQRLIQKHIIINYTDQYKLIIWFEFPPSMKLTSTIKQKNRRERQNRYLEHTNRNVLNSHFHGFVQAFQQKVLF
jgi:hypothetical protein